MARAACFERRRALGAGPVASVAAAAWAAAACGATTGAAGSRRSRRVVVVPPQSSACAAAKGGFGARQKPKAPPPPEGYDTEKKVFPIVKYPHPSLFAENKLVEAFDDRLRQLVENMFATLYDAGDGIGLAAPQIGVNLRVMVYNEDATNPINPFRHRGEIALVNPKIVRASEQLEASEESCLSFPEIFGYVKRPTWVEVEACDVEGNPISRRIENFEARLFQHEYDHLDGVTFVDRLSKIGRKEVQPMLDQLFAEFKMSRAARK